MEAISLFVEPKEARRSHGVKQDYVLVTNDEDGSVENGPALVGA